MIIPSGLLKSLEETKYVDDLHSPILEQLTLACFIEEGYLDRHVRVSKKTYQKKAQLIYGVITNTWNGLGEIEIQGHKAGIHMMVRVKGFKFTDKILRKLKYEGVSIYPVSDHTIRTNYEDYFLLGFGNLDVENIEKGLEKIKKIIGNNS